MTDASKGGRPARIVLFDPENPSPTHPGAVRVSRARIEEMASSMSITESARILGVPKSTYREFLVREGLRDLYGKEANE